MEALPLIHDDTVPQRALGRSHPDLVLENVFLRQQIALL